MKITPTSGPVVQPVGPDVAAEAAAKARAVAAFNNPSPATDQAAAQPLNGSNLSPEDMSAVRQSQPAVTPDQETPPSDGNATASAEVTPPTPQEIRKKASTDPESQRRFENLARQEKAFRAKVQQAQTRLNERETALKQREAQIQQRETPPDTSRIRSLEDIKNNPLQALADAGVTADEFAQAQMDYVPTDPRVMKMLEKQAQQIEKLNGALEEARQGQTQAQKAAYDAAITQIRADASKLVATDPDLEITKSYGKQGVNEVVSLIEKIYAKEKIVISVEEAAKLVEEDYAEEIAAKTKLGKIQRRLGSTAPAAPKATDTKPQTNSQPQTRTLTNAHTAQRPLTNKERAMLAFEGKLKG